MTERKYTLKYDLSDGQTGLDAGSFSVWDGDDGATLAGNGTYDIQWGYPEQEKRYAYSNRFSFNYDNFSDIDKFDPENFSQLILEVENYYRCNATFIVTINSLSFTYETETYIGKDGQSLSGKNGTYITAIRVEAA